MSLSVESFASGLARFRVEALRHRALGSKKEVCKIHEGAQGADSPKPAATTSPHQKSEPSVQEEFKGSGFRG